MLFRLHGCMTRIFNKWRVINVGMMAINRIHLIAKNWSQPTFGFF